MLLNWLRVLDSLSFGMETATALCHSDGMLRLVQAILMRVHKNFSTLEHFLYSLYGMSFGHGADATLACRTTCQTSQSFGADASKRTDGSGALGT